MPSGSNSPGRMRRGNWAMRNLEVENDSANYRLGAVFGLATDCIEAAGKVSVWLSATAPIVKFCFYGKFEGGAV